MSQEQKPKKQLKLGSKAFQPDQIKPKVFVPNQFQSFQPQTNQQQNQIKKYIGKINQQNVNQEEIQNVYKQQYQIQTNSYIKQVSYPNNKILKLNKEQIQSKLKDQINQSNDQNQQSNIEQSNINQQQSNNKQSNNNEQSKIEQSNNNEQSNIEQQNLYNQLIEAPQNMNYNWLKSFLFRVQEIDYDQLDQNNSEFYKQEISWINRRVYKVERCTVGNNKIKYAFESKNLYEDEKIFRNKDQQNNKIVDEDFIIRKYDTVYERKMEFIQKSKENKLMNHLKREMTQDEEALKEVNFLMNKIVDSNLIKISVKLYDVLQKNSIIIESIIDIIIKRVCMDEKYIVIYQKLFYVLIEQFQSNESGQKIQFRDLLINQIRQKFENQRLEFFEFPNDFDNYIQKEQFYILEKKKKQIQNILLFLVKCYQYGIIKYEIIVQINKILLYFFMVALKQGSNKNIKNFNFLQRFDHYLYFNEKLGITFYLNQNTQKDVKQENFKNNESKARSFLQSKNDSIFKETLKNQIKSTQFVQSEPIDVLYLIGRCSFLFKIDKRQKLLIKNLQEDIRLFKNKDQINLINSIQRQKEDLIQELSDIQQGKITNQNDQQVEENIITLDHINQEIISQKIQIFQNEKINNENQLDKFNEENNLSNEFLAFILLILNMEEKLNDVYQKLFLCIVKQLGKQVVNKLMQEFLYYICINKNEYPLANKYLGNLIFQIQDFFKCDVEIFVPKVPQDLDEEFLSYDLKKFLEQVFYITVQWSLEQKKNHYEKIINHYKVEDKQIGVKNFGN